MPARRVRFSVRTLMIAVAVMGLALGYVAWLGREDPRSEIDLVIRLAVGVVPSALFLLLIAKSSPDPPPP
jgi:hypothetical protein